MLSLHDALPIFGSDTASDSSEWPIRYSSAAAQIGVDRHYRYAQRVQGKPVQKESRAVLQQQAGPMAVAVAGRAIARLERFDPGQGVAIGNFPRLYIVRPGGFIHNA